MKARIRDENAALLVEKANWATSAASPEDAQRQWEAEKADLIKARDEAAATAKVGVTVVLSLYHSEFSPIE